MTDELRTRVDAVLRVFLEEQLGRVDRLDPSARPLVEEIGRLLEAGGKRLRPVFCYWGFRAAGGTDHGTPGEPIVRAAAALELLHTMALVHDDLIDGSKERRGVPSTVPWFAERADRLGARGEREAFGQAMSVLVGDLAAVLADRLLLESGFAPDALARMLAVYHPMREDMAIGQYLGLTGAGRTAAGSDAARRAARLRGGSYSVEGPLLLGAALAGDAPAVRDRLARYGRPLGEAFQLRDDLQDGEADAGVSPQTVNRLVDEAKASLDPDVLTPASVPVLRRLADRVAL